MKTVKFTKNSYARITGFLVLYIWKRANLTVSPKQYIYIIMNKLTHKQTCERLNCCEDTLQKYATMGLIPQIKTLTRRRYYLAKDVDRLEKQLIERSNLMQQSTKKEDK
jgi:hypothetical protein